MMQGVFVFFLLLASAQKAAISSSGTILRVQDGVHVEVRRQPENANTLITSNGISIRIPSRGKLRPSDIEINASISSEQVRGTLTQSLSLATAAKFTRYATSYRIGIGVAAAVVVVSLVAQFCLPEPAEKSPSVAYVRFTQAAALLRIFAHFVFVSKLFTTASSVAVISSNPGSTSGALIGAASLLMPMGALVGRALATSFRASRIGVNVFGLLFFANAAANAVLSDVLHGEGLVTALFATRLAHGTFGGALGVMLEASALHLTPAAGATGFLQLRAVAGTLGLGVGPLLQSALAMDVDPDDTTGQVDAAPSYVAAGIIGIAVVCAFVAQGLAVDVTADEKREETQSEDSPMDASSGALLQESLRKWVWVLGIIVYTNGANIVTCVQTGQTWTLEQDYSFKAADISWGLTITSICCVPPLLLLLLFTHVSHLLWIGLLTLLCAIYLVPARRLSSQGMTNSLFVTSGIIYCCVCGAASLSTSATNSSSIEGSAVFSKSNLVVLMYILDGTFIFASATFSRYFVRERGVDGYLLLLVILTSVQLLLYCATVYLFYIGQGREEKQAADEETDELLKKTSDE